jgi:hypothetical protein
VGTWSATVSDHHDLVPDGCVELLWIDGRGVRVCGPDTHGWSVDLPVGTMTTGIRFRPGAGDVALGFLADELVDRRARLGEVLSDRADRRLDDELSSAGGAVARRQALERFARTRLGDTESEPMIAAARDVVRHVVDVHQMMLRPLDRTLSPAPSVDDDPLGAFQAARADVASVLDDPALAKTEYDGQFGRSVVEQTIDGFLAPRSTHSRCPP